MKLIICITGITGCGKDTVYNMLMKANPDFKPYIWYTTRPMREDEVDGKIYHFIDDETTKSEELLNHKYFGDDSDVNIVYMKSYIMEGGRKVFYILPWYKNLEDAVYILCGASADEFTALYYWAEIRRNFNYRVEMIHMDISKEEAYRRVLKRAKSTGESTDEISRRIEKDYDEYAAIPDTLKLNKANCIDAERSIEEVFASVQNRINELVEELKNG